jgi:hypothetical protein
MRGKQVIVLRSLRMYSWYDCSNSSNAQLAQSVVAIVYS